MSLLFAEVKPVEVTVSETSFWTGERARFTIELRAKGSFSGTAYFDLPEMPGIFILKTGNPVVGSEEIERESWFTQTHQFSLFSQKSGEVILPAIPIRFAAKEGFTGEAKEVSASTEPVTLRFQRPPGTQEIPFLVSTESLEISETWDPEPGDASLGDVIRRTILQRSQSIPGMALVPAPAMVPEGVRLYDPSVETKDNFERGAFRGERRETLTYLLQAAGTVALPEMEFAWWNPSTETVETKTLPGPTLEVADLPSVGASSQSKGRGVGLFFLIASFFFGLFLMRRTLISVIRKFALRVYPEEARRARVLRQACRRNDPAAAEQAWNRWSLGLSSGGPVSEALRREVTRLQRIRFGPDSGLSWEGSSMLRELRVERRRRQKPIRGTGTSLPDLNFPARSN
ncbi:MAG: hypothetical protein AAF733_06565 [Verrucomicrobiota bacterium]